MTASVTTDLCDLVTAARLAEPKLSATQVQAFTSYSNWPRLTPPPLWSTISR